MSTNRDNLKFRNVKYHKNCKNIRLSRDCAKWQKYTFIISFFEAGKKYNAQIEAYTPKHALRKFYKQYGTRKIDRIKRKREEDFIKKRFSRW